MEKIPCVMFLYAEEKGKRLGRGPIIVSVEEDSLVVRPIKKSFLNYLNFI